MKSMKTLTKQANEAADRWTELLVGKPLPEHVSTDSGDWRNSARILARSAFLLYSIEWNGSADDFDVRQWTWPFLCLRERSEYPSRPERVFDGLQPWSALLQRAVKLSA